MINHPIVHCITNYVAMEFTANALLAIGARPLMSTARQEMEDIAHVADALLINIGTLDDNLIESAIVAGQAMASQGKPVVLDPVGVQVSEYRMQAVVRIIEMCNPCIIKGNKAEMAALASVLAKYKGVAVTTGEVDEIVQGEHKERVKGGSVRMTQVTAMGCVAGALMAALASEKEPFAAAVEGSRRMKKAGEEAETDKGLGSYRVRFIDSLSRYV